MWEFDECIKSWKEVGCSNVGELWLPVTNDGDGDRARSRRCFEFLRGGQKIQRRRKM